MTYKICYWDEIDRCQKERDATSDETFEINTLKANPIVIIPPAPTKADLLAQLAALSAQIQALE
jgi:hypothetical protein